MLVPRKNSEKTHIQNKNLKAHIFAIITIALFIGSAIALLISRKPKYDIQVSFHIANCFPCQGDLVLKGDVVLKNGTDSPLLLDGQKLAENMTFVMTDPITGTSHTANGNLLNSIQNIGIGNINQHKLKVPPRDLSESSFLTSFNGELQLLDFKRIYCFINIDGQVYYSPTELVRLK